VVVGDRDLPDESDHFRCFRAGDGRLAWEVSYPAAGKLDYGNQPRATPLISEGQVFLYGAFSDLTCVESATGRVVWRKNLRDTYQTEAEFVWGACASPLIADGKLIVNPGAADATIVALDPLTGDEIWRASGPPPAYGSFLAANLGGKLQVIGHDRESLGGWDVQTGNRLWTLHPTYTDDFNVPTPVQCGELLLIASENNGTRLYQFRSDGVIDPTPIATNDDLAPDICTPVMVGSRLFCSWGSLFCLDLEQGLSTIWTAQEPALRTHASLVAGPNRVLMIGDAGALFLVDATADQYEVVSRVQVFQQGAEIYAHPAMVGHRLYVRGETELVCFDVSGR
jgi:outer membrane protein assembly factor BamB